MSCSFAVGEEAVQLLAQAGCSGDVDLAAHGEHGPLAFFVYDEAQIHEVTTLPDDRQPP